MSESIPSGQSTSNQVQQVTGSVVQAGHIESMTVNYASAAPGGPPPGRGGPGKPTLVVAIAGVVAVSATLLVIADGTFGSEASPSTPSSSTTSVVPSPTTTSPSIAPTTTSPPLDTRTTTVPPPAPPVPRASGPLSMLKPIGEAVFRDELIPVDEVSDVKAKVAHLSCAGGTPAPLTETYELGGAYRKFTGRVTVKSKPANAGPVTFTIFADDVRVAFETLPIARTEDIQADLVGARRLTLKVTTATCVDIDAAWAEPELLVP